MDSDWFTRIYQSILAEQFCSKIEILYDVQNRLWALLEAANINSFIRRLSSIELHGNTYIQLL